MQTFTGVIAKFVAQVGNRLCRRLAVGEFDPRPAACGLPIRDTADCQSVLQPAG